MIHEQWTRIIDPSKMNDEKLTWTKDQWTMNDEQWITINDQGIMKAEKSTMSNE